jgi:hypothetical protein
MDAPVDWIKSVGSLRFPPKADHRLRNLMDRDNEGLLGPGEREELEALAELSRRAVPRAGQGPPDSRQPWR